MGHNTIMLPLREQATTGYTFETVESLTSITAAAEQLAQAGNGQMALVVIKLGFDHPEGKTNGHALHTADKSSAYLLNSLRPHARKTDGVFLLAHTMYFLLRGANLQGGEIVQNRLWEVLLWQVHNLTGAEALRPSLMSIGHSDYGAENNDINTAFEEAGIARLRIDRRQPEQSARKVAAQQAHIGEAQDADEALPALARKLGIPYLTLLPRKMPAQLQRLVKPQLALELRCFPLGRERNTLTVAMPDPQDASVLERLERETGMQIFPVLAPPETIQRALEQLV